MEIKTITVDGEVVSRPKFAISVNPESRKKLRGNQKANRNSDVRKTKTFVRSAVAKRKPRLKNKSKSLA